MATKKKAKAQKSGRRSPLSGLRIIKLTKKGENPHHEGTHSRHSFSLIRSGMTVDEFMSKGGRTTDLKVSIARGFVKLDGKPRAAAAKPKASKKSAKKVASKKGAKKKAAAKTPKKKAKAAPKRAKTSKKKAKGAPKRAKAAPRKKAAAKPQGAEKAAAKPQATGAKGGEISESFPS